MAPKGESENSLADIDEGYAERRRAVGTIYSKEKGKEVGLDDFEIRTIIGKGSFGKVFLVIKKDDGKVYAMKSIKKEVMLENDQIESAKMEKKILLHNKHPFLVKMSYIFQTEDKVFFVMNLVRGGELFTILNKERRFNEEKVKFYAIQIVLAIGYLHKQGIIYRDIKPENILVNEDGYLALTDFGLAKTVKTNELAQTFWGTPEYLAPEIIKETGHSYAVDWWAIGILIYEMLVGFPPFYHKNQHTMYDLIEKFPVKFPDKKKHGIDMSDDAKDILSKLLEKNPDDRLGSDGGIEEVLSHPWFDAYDVDKLLNKQYEPPYIPDLSEDMEDVSNFDKRFTAEQVKNTIITKKELAKIQMHEHEFNDF